MGWNANKISQLIGVINQKVSTLYSTSKSVGIRLVDKCSSCGKFKLTNMFIKMKANVTKTPTESTAYSRFSIISLYMKCRAVFFLSIQECSEASSGTIELLDKLYVGRRNLFTHHSYEETSTSSYVGNIVNLCIDKSPFKYRAVTEFDKISSTISKVSNLGIYSKESLKE